VRSVLAVETLTQSLGDIETWEITVEHDSKASEAKYISISSVTYLNVSN
jgi:hypothetical protein